MTEPVNVIIEAVATAVQSRKPLSQSIERAMADAVTAASEETEVIWADSSLSLEEKQRQIAAITDPTAIKQRMLAARDLTSGKPQVAP